MSRFLLFLIFCFPIAINAQNIKSPSEFLGVPLGTQFNRHHNVISYYKYLAQNDSDRIKLINYGTTNEKRNLFLAIISSKENIADLEQIRQEHLKSLYGKGNQQKAIVWLSYNVHGNEAVSTEASMKTIYELLTAKNEYLENIIIIIDPCLNPDGRDRYVNWYNQFKNTPHQADPNSKEHHEGWLTGRSNHYMFDLNRDWAWLTQKESQQRIIQYNLWMPHIHVDFHEQGVNDPYYFAPAAEPYHEVITDFQRNFQKIVGKNHAKYFDANGWLYFTKERFDLFYPSYGDTYPTYNGSIGMTYEQGGSGRAGLEVITDEGDTLSLKDRIDHHYTTGLSTIEIASKNVEILNEEYKNFFRNKKNDIKSYVLSGNQDHLIMLEDLLSKHDIEFGRAKKETIKGYNYLKGKNTKKSIGKNDLVVSTNQPKGTMVKVLLEANAKLSDSLTYDITAWSLPYAYGLETIASKNLIEIDTTQDRIFYQYIGKPIKPIGYITDWNSMNDARFLAEILQNGIKVRTAHSPLRVNKKSFAQGSLIILEGDNKDLEDLQTALDQFAIKHKKRLHSVNTGYVENGKDFGSNKVKMIKAPKVAVLSGEPTSTYRFGEIWHFFEQQLNYPLTVIESSYLDRVDLKEYDILVLPGGFYRRFFNKERSNNLKDWVNNGGKLVLMGGAIKSFLGENGFSIKQKIMPETTKESVTIHKNQQRQAMKNAITGAIFKAKVDSTHPLAYGYNDTYFSLKIGNNAFDYLPKGNVVYLDNNTIPVSGFAGSQAQDKIKQTLIFGAENYGKGQVIYMVDNPLFRGFWENGKLFFANALFMVK